MTFVMPGGYPTRCTPARCQSQSPPPPQHEHVAHREGLLDHEASKGRFAAYGSASKFACLAQLTSTLTRFSTVERVVPWLDAMTRR